VANFYNEIRIDNNTGTFVAIKVVNLEEDNDGIEEIKREVSVLCHCFSPYVIKYHGSYLNGSQLWIVMDYCGVGSLRQILVHTSIRNNVT
jgi:serine/threonine-protein kinase 24/25/MST4